MASDDTGDDLYTPAQHREHLDGYGERDPLSHEFAGIVQDPLVNRYLGVLSNHYDPTEADDPAGMPARFAGLEDVQQIVSLAAAKRSREAMADGDMQMLKHLTGQTDCRYDDKEPTSWSWSGGEEEDLDYDDVVEDVAMWTIVNEREKDDPVAYRKLATKTPWDASTYSRRWKRYKEDGKYVDAVQRVEDIIA